MDVLTSTFPVYIDSNTSRDVYPENEHNHFRCKLNSVYHFNESVHKTWHVGLTKVGLKTKMFNMGPNTDSVIYLIYRGCPFEISTPQCRAETAKEVCLILNKQIAEFSLFNKKLLDPKTNSRLRPLSETETKLPELSDLITFREWEDIKKYALMYKD